MQVLSTMIEAMILQESPSTHILVPSISIAFFCQSMRNSVKRMLCKHKFYRREATDKMVALLDEGAQVVCSIYSVVKSINNLC